MFGALGKKVAPPPAIFARKVGGLIGPEGSILPLGSHLNPITRMVQKLPLKCENGYSRSPKTTSTGTRSAATANYWYHKQLNTHTPLLVVGDILSFAFLCFVVFVFVVRVYQFQPRYPKEFREVPWYTQFQPRDAFCLTFAAAVLTKRNAFTESILVKYPYASNSSPGMCVWVSSGE